MDTWLVGWVDFLYTVVLVCVCVNQVCMHRRRGENVVSIKKDNWAGTILSRHFLLFTTREFFLFTFKRAPRD